MNYASPSPPPLRHPIPTHPAYIPEPPPSQPGSPTPGYQRFTSSPGPGPSFPQQQQQQHVPAYAHYQPPPVPMQPAPQGYGQQHVDLNAWGINDATAQLGMQLGNSAVHAGQEYVQKNFGGIFQGAGVKHKFNVSNGYVLRKLAMLLFPWTHKPWSRRGRRTEQGQMEYSDPREDVNSPDLYIPLMALVTYILVSAFHSGLQDRFHPSVLGSYATTAVVVALFDTGFVSLACYVLSVPQSQPLDVMAYTGYKFVGVIATILAGFVVGRTIWLGVYLYFFLANAFFMLRSLRSVVLPDLVMQGTQTTSPGSRRRRIFFLFLEAACQVIYMGILVRV